ncbi:hypothetical protein EMCRGX_G010415 [Ephydatia muelleri]
MFEEEEGGTQPVRAISKYQIRTVKTTEAVPQLQQSVLIKGKPFMFEVDTGAGDTFCAEDVWCDLGKPPLSPATGRYEVANGQPLPTLGIFSTIVTLQVEDSSDGKAVEFTVTKVPRLNLLGWDAITFKQALSKSSLPPRAALQEFLIQYRRTPRSEGYSPSELLNGRQIWTKIDVLLPSPAHAAQGKQAKEATRREKDPRWVPAVVTKVYGSRSVSVRVCPRGGTWRRHIEQLHPRYGVQEDADPREVQVSSMEPVLAPPLAEVVALTADSSELCVPTAEPTRIPAKPMRVYRNPRLPTGSDYSRDNPRRSTRHHQQIHRTGDNFAFQ